MPSTEYLNKGIVRARTIPSYIDNQEGYANLSPRGDALDHPEPHGPVGARAPHVRPPAGVAVHRAVGVGGDVERARDVVREHEAEGVVERHPERRLHPRLGDDAERRLAGGERLVHQVVITLDRSHTRSTRMCIHIVSCT